MRDGCFGIVPMIFAAALLLSLVPAIPTAQTLGVEVSISPSYRSGFTGQYIGYTVYVANVGSLDENFVLSASDDAGWDLYVWPKTLEVPAGESRGATLRVGIPLGAVPGTEDNIVITARSLDNAVSASAGCVAVALPWASIGLRFDLTWVYGLKEVLLVGDFVVPEGSALVMKFHNYVGGYEGEVAVGKGPAHVVLPYSSALRIGHPENKWIENAWLVLVDDENNLIRPLMGYVRTWSHFSNLVAGRIGWRNASGSERVGLGAAIANARLLWRGTYPDAWIPLIPFPEQVRLEPAAGENVSIRATLTTQWGYLELSDWGSPQRADNSFTAEAKIEMRSGYQSYKFIERSHTYNLGALAPGTYSFTFKVWGYPVKTIEFEVPPH